MLHGITRKSGEVMLCNLELLLRVRRRHATHFHSAGSVSFFAMEKQSLKGDHEGRELPFFIAYPLTANLLLFIGYALAGMLYFIFVMGLSPSTAFYAVVQILTTIGWKGFGERVLFSRLW